MEHGVHEDSHVEEEIQLSRDVELWVFHADLVVKILVEGTHGQHRKGCEEHVVASYENVVIDGLRE